MYKIDITKYPPEMKFDEASIIDDIYLSLKIKRGSYIFDKDFGCRIYEIDKITKYSINLAKDYVYEAIKWLIDEGRIVEDTLSIIVERNALNNSRLDIVVSGKTIDKTSFSIETFVVII